MLMTIVPFEAGFKVYLATNGTSSLESGNVSVTYND